MMSDHVAKKYCADDKFETVIDAMALLEWERVMNANVDGEDAEAEAEIEDLALIWTNLKNCTSLWTNLKENQVINHIKGAHHLSNKSFLAYHMHCSSNGSAGSTGSNMNEHNNNRHNNRNRISQMMPAQWSAAYQDLGQLIGMINLNTVYGLCLSYLKYLKNLNYPTMSRSSPSISSHTDTVESNTPDIPDIPDISADIDDISIIEMTRRLDSAAAVQRILLMDEEWGRSDKANISIKAITALQQCKSIAAIESIETIADTYTITDSDSDRVRERERERLLMRISITITELEKFEECRDYYGIMNTWIVKPVGSSCGDNITVCRGMSQVIADVRRKDHKCVVQKYIERPLLVRNDRKFDVRQWILVTSTEPMVIYGFSEFYCRLSGKTYDMSDSSLLDSTVHLCNFAIQKHKQKNQIDIKGNTDDLDQYNDTPYSSGESLEPLEPLEPLESTMMTHRQFVRNLGIHGSAIMEERIMPQIRDIAVQTVRSARDKLYRVSQGFEWLGLDLLISDTMHVKMIECNVSPDISRSTGVTARLVDAATRGVIDLAILDPDQDQSKIEKIKTSKGNAGIDTPNTPNIPNTLKKEKTETETETEEEEEEQSGLSGSRGLESDLKWELWHDSSRNITPPAASPVYRTEHPDLNLEKNKINRSFNKDKDKDKDEDSKYISITISDHSEAGKEKEKDKERGGEENKNASNTNTSKTNQSVFAFARAKREVAILGTDYAPKKKHIFDRVQAYFNTAAAVKIAKGPSSGPEVSLNAAVKIVNEEKIENIEIGVGGGGKEIEEKEEAEEDDSEDEL